MSGGAIFEYGWREDHARAGDHALAVAEDLVREPGQERLIQEIGPGRITSTNIEEALMVATTLAAIAQAHYAAANVRTRPIRDAELRLPFNFKALLEDSYSTGSRREGGCPIARFDHASPPYGPQCEWPVGHAGDHAFPA